MTVGGDRVTEAQVRRELIRMDGKIGRRRARIAAVAMLALALVAGALIAAFAFALVDIRTAGMADALQCGDVVLCERMGSPVRTGELRRGSLALVRWQDNGLQRQTVRRVVAMGGDVVTVERDGRVTVNDVELEEPYAAYRTQIDDAPGGAVENPFASPGDTTGDDQEAALYAQVDDQNYPLTVPEGQLFVLCDDRENPMDSRSSRFGLINEANVLGLARAVVWPVYRVSLLADDGSR